MRNIRNYLVVHSVVDGPYIADPPTPPTPPAPVTYTVKLESGTGYTAAFVAGSSSPALAGSSVYFTIIPAEGYEIYKVKNGTNTLTPVKGIYKIDGIVADTTIVVEVIPDPVTHTVTFTGTSYCKAAFVAGSSSPAVAGSTVNFTVVADEGYEITSVTYEKGPALAPVNGVYTINAIAADTTIRVDARSIPAPVTYTVTLPPFGTGYTAAFVAGSSSLAVAGSVVNFTVAATEGYEITSVTDGTNTLTPVNGVYTINEIAADTIITVVATLL